MSYYYEHRFETQIHIQRHIRIITIFTLVTKHLMIVNKDNLYLHFKFFWEHLVLSCCVTPFLRRYPANLAFLVLQWSFFTYIITTGSQTSHITPIFNEKPLTRSKNLSENLSLKLLCDVVFPSFPSQSDIPCIRMSNFESHEYP